LWHTHANPSLFRPIKQEPQESQEAQYDDDTVYPEYYHAQEHLPTSQLNLHYSHTTDGESQERPHMVAYHVRINNPQQSTLSGGMLQSRSSNTSPIRRPVAHRHPLRPGHGYGKINFITKPESLGDINSWSLQERQDNRRIVAFTKEISGDFISLNCYPVASHEYQEKMITISCIRWIPGPPYNLAHKLSGQCVFTSVDIILLLEKLVGYTFDVQEKNRIRRNLEGFKPETVRKDGKTGQFFNQVMLYAQPKTRNIEKDIKVFLWKDLQRALKKVVQKYSKKKEKADNTRNSEPGLPSNALSSLPGTQPSSTESLSTQQTFIADHRPEYNGDNPETPHYALMEWHPMLHSNPHIAHSTMPLLQPFSGMESATMAGSQMYYSQDESWGDTSSMSISPTSQITQLGMEYGHIIDGSSGSTAQQALEAYVHDIPGDFSM
jgi:hypothetical protein